ncbi:hypothetical protein TNCV_2261781 [Trichonephila clavipes]|nr:hypothetical protein TNCV_2261781 [Trichonephila clavipes]
MQWLLCVLTWISGHPNAAVMVVHVPMKREMNFICPQDVNNPGGIFFHFREGPLLQMLPSVRYLLAKVHGTIAICKGTAGRFDERILRTDDGGKPNRLAASRALLIPEAASDAIASISTAIQGARASFKHGRPARARSSSFQFLQNV